MMATRQPELFDGTTFNEKRDGTRLLGQLKRVRELMSDGVWRTLGEIHAIVGGSEAGISARLRDLRKEKFGARKVQRRRRNRGNSGPDPKSALWEYAVSA